MSLCFCFDFVCVCLFCLFFLALNKNLPWPFANQRHSSWSPEKTWRWWSASSAGLPVPNRVLSCFIHTNTSRIYNAQRNGLSFLFFSSFKIIRKKKKSYFNRKSVVVCWQGLNDIVNLNHWITKQRIEWWFLQFSHHIFWKYYVVAQLLTAYSVAGLFELRRYIIYYIMTSMDEKDNAIWQLSKRTSSQSQYTFTFYMFLYMASIFKTVICCLYRAACIMMCLERPP